MRFNSAFRSVIFAGLVCARIAQAETIGIFPEPFFDRWSRADVVVEGKISQIKQSKISLSGEFSKYPKESVRVAKLDVKKVWKGKPWKSSERVYYIDDRSAGAGSEADLALWDVSYVSKSNLNSVVYLRRISGVLVASERFGFFYAEGENSPKSEVNAISSLLRKESPEKVIQNLNHRERFIFNKALEDKSKAK